MIRKSDKLVEATMLALQGKLELKENRVSRKTKKSEGIDVNVDNTTTVSVEGNETIVDTEDATVIVSKKEDEFVPETSDDLPMEAPVEEPVVDAPVAPDEDIVEVPADDTVMPEEIVDEPVDTELPTEESKKLESVEIEVSDDGKEVEVTTDNGEEVEVKDETPEENEDGEVSDTETEVSADDEPSIDEMIEESKKEERNLTRYERQRKNYDNIWQKYNNTIERYCEFLRRLGYSEERIEKAKQNTGLSAHELWDIVQPEAEKLGPDVWHKLNSDTPLDEIIPPKIKNECDKVVEDTEEYLEPRYDTRNSFYKKAKVVTKDNGDEELYSYGTHVGGVRGGKPYSKGRFSQTTSRHQKEFFKQRGVDPNKVDVEEGKHLKVKSLRKAEGIRAVEEYEYDFNDLYDIVGSNGKSVLNDIKKANKEEEFMDYVNSIMGEDTGRVPTVGEVSDFIDYDFETIFRDLEIKTEGKQADRNEEEIKAKKCSNCIKHENKARSKKVQEMIARRQKKSEALNKLNKTLVENRENIKAEKVVENKDDLGINEEVPKKEEPVPNTAEANLKVENKFSSKSFNEALTKYYKDRILAVESVEVTKLSKTRTGLKLEANLLSKSGKLKRAICLEMKQIQTGKSFDKYEVIETKGLVKENKSDNTKTTMTTFTNKQNIIECRYILTK